MPQHKDHRDVTLTETGRMSPKSLYDIDVRYDSVSTDPGLNAEPRFRITDSSATDDFTVHEMRLFTPSTTAPIRTGSVFWKRSADESNALESPRCTVDQDFRDPPSVGSTSTPSGPPASSWRPVLDMADAWTFKLEIWLDAWNGYRYTLVEEQRTSTKISWRIDVEAPTGGIVYQAHLAASAISQQL
jgi:hypothetical protein